MTEALSVAFCRQIKLGRDKFKDHRLFFFFFYFRISRSQNSVSNFKQNTKLYILAFRAKGKKSDDSLVFIPLQMMFLPLYFVYTFRECN